MSDYSSILALLEKHAPPKKPHLPPATDIRVAATKQVLHKRPGRGWRVPKYAVLSMKKEYDRLGTLEATGELFGLHKSEVGKLFSRNKIVIRTAPPTKFLIHNGKKYIWDGHRYYGLSGRGNKGILLHKVIWEDRHGPVPDGHLLAFVTANREDFSDANIELLTKKQFFAKMRKTRWDRHRARAKMQVAA